MIGKVRIETVKSHTDDRGVVYEPVDGETVGIQKNVHVVINLPGAVRGNHYHRHGTETMSVSGPAIVALRESQSVQTITVPDSAVFRFTIPPHVSHAIQNTGDKPSVLVAFNTVAHDPSDPDTEEDILLVR